MNTLQLSLADIILALLQSLFMRVVVLVVLLLATNKDKYMRGNHSFNRGPKSIQGRMRALQNLRNVKQIAVDKQYKINDDGMIRKRAREAVVNNEFTRQVKNKIVKPKNRYRCTQGMGGHV